MSSHGEVRELPLNDPGEPHQRAHIIEPDRLEALLSMRALKEHGYRIPEDVSIVGFDDMPMSYVTSPKLTTIHVPKELLGGSAVSLLLKQIASSDSQPATICMRIGTMLVLRDTVYDLRK